MSNQEIFSQQGGGLVPDITRPLTAAMGTKWNGNGDLESSLIPEVITARMVAFGEYECDDSASTLKMRDYKDATDLVAHTLRGEGFDASKDGTGRSTPLVPIAFYPTNRQPEFGNYTDLSPSVKVGSSGSSGNPPAVAFERRMVRTTGGQPQEELSHCLRADAGTGDGAPCVAYGFNGDQSEKTRSMGEREENAPTLPADGPAHVAVAFAQNTRDEVREMPIVGALAAEPGMKQTSYIRQQMQVRRLTPRECERLQGFPDDHTLIPWRGKTAPDGPRYKALGNSMAVPVMRWIGQRIAHLESTNPTPTTP